MQSSEAVHPVENVRDPRNGIAARVDARLHLGRGRARDQIDAAVDHGQRVVDLVGGRVGEARHVLPEILPAAVLFHPPVVGDVAREAADVHEASVFPEPIGGDQHVPDRAIARSQPRFPRVHGLAAAEPRQDVGDRVTVDVEIGDVAADVLLAGVAEQVELRLVDTQHGAVGPDPLQAQRGVLEEVGQRALAARQRILRARALGDVQRDAEHADDLRAAGAPRLHVHPVHASLLLVLIDGRHAAERSEVGGQRRIGGIGRAEIIAEGETDDFVGTETERSEPGAARVDEAQVEIGRPHDGR